MKWFGPWYSIVEASEIKAAMERELQSELSPGHRLFGLPAEAVARCRDCDDVLFLLRDGTGRVAVVHLTWTLSPPEPAPWPSTIIFDSPEAWWCQATGEPPLRAPGVRVEITRYADASPPGWVECRLVDVRGRTWSFFAQVPAVSEARLDACSTYPQPGVIACELLSQGDAGVRFDTRHPAGLESLEGETRFEVAAELLVERAPRDWTELFGTAWLSCGTSNATVP